VPNREILDSFFKSLFENTTAGYVICGVKPIYLGNFCRPEWLMPGSAEHLEAIHAFLALKILKKLPQDSKLANYILVNQGLDSIPSQNNEFMIINQKAFLRVVKENLVLFKYKFGHDITPENLLKKLISSNHGFSKLFGKEIALQGIVLGYGTNNSISYERASTFTELVASNTPSSPPNKLLPPPANEEEMITRIESLRTDGNWMKVKEETKDFSFYQSQNPNDKLKIPFSIHQNSIETIILLKEYRKAQNRLNSVLTNKNILNYVLKHLKIKNEVFSPQSENLVEMFTNDEKKTLSQVLARSIQYTFSEQISPEFIMGMRAAMNKNEENLDLDFKKVRFLEILREQTFPLLATF